MKISKAEIIQWEEVVKGSFNIQARYPVSSKNSFEDDMWDFRDRSKQRLNSVSDDSLVFNWAKWSQGLTKEIIEDLKIITFFLLKVPRVYSNKQFRGGNGYKINTVTSMVATLVRFLEHVVTEKCLGMVGISGGTVFSTLEEIQFEDLRDGIDTFEYAKYGLKQALLFVCNPVSKQYVKYPVEWIPADVENLHFTRKSKNKSFERYSNQPLDDHFFRFLSRQATEDVYSFLQKLNITSTSHPATEEALFEHCPDLSQMFEDYVAIRESDKKYSLIVGRRTQATNLERQIFLRKYQITVNDFSRKLSRLHKAAIYLLIQYTGVRYSESISFKVGCLRKLDTGQFVVVGTQTKFIPTNIPIDKDQWIACPIVIDAVTVLEQLTRFTFNQYLVSKIFAVYRDDTDLKPMSRTGLTNALLDYVKEIDTRHQFCEKAHMISLHRLRHTLALQMIRAELGIPYITYHLKHLHNAVSAFRTVNDVTIGYGGISKEIFNNATAIRQTQRELAKSLYHPDSPVEGGDKENFRKRREEFFQGMMMAGWEIDEILDHLASNSLPFADVGLGYCGGKKDIVKPSGKVEHPPCVGQLQCNPNQCHNAVITIEKIPVWKKVLEENTKKLHDPQLQHAKDIHLAFVEEAKSVLLGLGVSSDEVDV
ncbi:tyrosine-type recombinase/integrase [Paenibacillus ferrarius]|uniref:tyrosine-type recombinase/integrase n=1 Tax=Paenibacillus ferrarius TaxID=1469647 RepID=UPI003D2D9236